MIATAVVVVAITLRVGVVAATKVVATTPKVEEVAIPRNRPPVARLPVHLVQLRLLTMMVRRRMTTCRSNHLRSKKAVSWQRQM
jgi:hypothetical protein